MAFNLRNRSFLRELDFTPQEWSFLLGLAEELKRARYGGSERPRLAGRRIALLFEKASTRTRCAFEVAAFDQGAHVTYLDPSGAHVGHKESMKDTARVLGRMYDAVGYRGSAQEDLETLAAYAGVPVWNGLTDQWHPTQMLGDVITMREHCPKPDDQISLAYLGDARNNVANSLLVTGALTGMDVRIAAPHALWADDEVVKQAAALAHATGARLVQTEDVASAVEGVDFVYTDVWVSMGEPASRWDERIELLRPYRVDAELLARSGNPAVKFMHCLPAFHDRHTAVGEEIRARTGLDALEVTDEVFEGPASIVFDQAENRVHTIKAVMVATLGD